MNISVVLDMAATGSGDRIAFGTAADGLGYGELRRRARAGAALIARAGAERVVYIAGNGVLFPITLFACAYAGVPLVPLNYRLGRARLGELLAAQPASSLVVSEDPGTVEPYALKTFTPGEWARRISSKPPPSPGIETTDDAAAILLYTSGTTSAPKAAVLRHRHLLAYILGSVEFGSAAAGDSALVTVPPYHIAGVAGVLSNVYAGRRVVYLDRFEPDGWLRLAAAERITNAMLVPTMLARIVARLDAGGTPAPPIRSIAYGGAHMPLPVIENALGLFPGTDFTNAYGLTETSSTIAVLGPEDHRAALAATDPEVRARLRSAGRPVPGLELRIRDESGGEVTAGTAGELWVRGPQVSGEYVGTGSATDAEGWFRTRDLARVDHEGYLFIEGRLDDTIIRGGENIAPAELEDVILRHPAIAACAVVGLPDEEWGHRIAAVVVTHPESSIDPAALRGWLATRLRTSRTPDDIRIWPELPQTDTGKILRRKVLEALIQ